MPSRSIMNSAVRPNARSVVPGTCSTSYCACHDVIWRQSPANRTVCERPAASSSLITRKRSGNCRKLLQQRKHNTARSPTNNAMVVFQIPNPCQRSKEEINSKKFVGFNEFRHTIFDVKIPSPPYTLKWYKTSCRTSFAVWPRYTSGGETDRQTTDRKLVANGRTLGQAAQCLTMTMCSVKHQNETHNGERNSSHIDHGVTAPSQLIWGPQPKKLKLRC